MPDSGSLIVAQSSGSPKHYNTTTKSKFDDFGFKHSQFVRHDSEKQLTKTDLHKPSFMNFPLDNKFRLEEEQRPKNGALIYERPRNSEVITKRKSNSKLP